MNEAPLQNIESAVRAPNGELYVSGNIGREQLGDQYRLDLFVSRYDERGERLWTRRFTPGAQQNDSSIALDPCGGVVAAANSTGGASPGTFVVHLDAEGNVRGERLLSGTEPRKTLGVSVTANQVFLLVNRGQGSGTTAITRIGAGL